MHDIIPLKIHSITRYFSARHYNIIYEKHIHHISSLHHNIKHHNMQTQYITTHRFNVVHPTWAMSTMYVFFY